MALILKDSFCYVAGYDFTTDTNNATLNNEVIQLDRTTFGSGGWTELAAGLKAADHSHSGFWQANDTTFQVVDNQAFNNLGSGPKTNMVGPVETEGQPAYMFRATSSQYTLGGQVGELMPFSLTANGSRGNKV